MLFYLRALIVLLTFTICLPAYAHELLAAVWSRNIRLVESLLEDGADVDETDVRGWTPLMYAVFRDDQDIAIKLLDSGANVNADNTRTESRDIDGVNIISRST